MPVTLSFAWGYCHGRATSSAGTDLHTARLARNAVENSADVAELFSHCIAEFLLSGSNKHGPFIESFKCLAALGFVPQRQQLQHGRARAKDLILTAGHVIKVCQYRSSLKPQSFK